MEAADGAWQSGLQSWPSAPKPLRYFKTYLKYEKNPKARDAITGKVRVMRRTTMHSTFPGWGEGVLCIRHQRLLWPRCPVCACSMCCC